MVGEGIIEISGEKIKTTREDIRKLKSILDELHIMHIIDDVVCYSPSEAAEHTKEINTVRMWKIEKDGDVSLKNRFGRSEQFEYRELIIPDLFEINYMRLLLLDDENYRFLGNLLYGPDHQSN